MRVLILGSTGFIGSSLLKIFQSQGCDLTSLNRQEFSNSCGLLDIIKSTNAIINCIGSANVTFSYSNSSCDFDSNVEVVRNVLEILRKYNLTHIKFINLSSAAVYGNPLSLPVKEIDSIQPLSPYGYHKLMAEMLLKEYSQCFGLNTQSLRVFSAYGNGQKKLLLWDLHEKIQKSKDNKIVLFGTGNESRDFIHVEDIAQQILLAIDYADFNGEALNVANGVEVKISEVVEFYQEFYPKHFVYEFNGEVRLGDPKNWCADVSMMRSWDYQSRVGIEQGIKSYINWAVCQ